MRICKNRDTATSEHMREKRGKPLCASCVFGGSSLQLSLPAQILGKVHSTYHHKGAWKLLHLQIRKENGVKRWAGKKHKSALLNWFFFYFCKHTVLLSSSSNFSFKEINTEKSNTVQASMHNGRAAWIGTRCCLFKPA